MSKKYEENPFKDDFKIPVSKNISAETELDIEVEEKKEKPSSSVAERIKLMQQHRLRADTVPVGGEVNFADFEDFKRILGEYKREERYKEDGKKFGWSQKKLAAHYILEGIKRDKKKFDI